MPAPLTPEQIGHIIRDTERAATRPQRLTLGDVGAHVAEALLAGMGAALLFGGALYLLAAPGDVIASVAATSGVLAMGVRLALAVIPNDKIATVRRMQQVQRTVLEAEFRKREAYRAIETLEAEHSAAMQQLQTALAELRQQNRALQAELRRHQEAKRSKNFVTRAKIDGEAEAVKILEHWFATLQVDGKGRTRGKWWSRGMAEQAGWTQSQQAAALALLLDAGIAGLNGKIPFILDEYKALDGALFALNKFCDSAASEPILPPRQSIMSNEDED